MHTFRKYISNRGSALFMVISTMTALMITCMAMYFTVVASRSTTYTIFNQKQSYQNAISIYNMLLNDAQSEFSALRDTMVKMEVNAEMSTSGSDELLGDYVITIKRLEDQKENGINNQVFDIIVTSTVKGVSETVHSQTYYQPPSTKEEIVSNPNVSLSPTFAATGYVPNDVYLDKGHFNSDMYFDNEVTYFGAYDSSELFGYGDINCAGSVVMTQNKSMTLCKDNKPMVFSIRNTLTVPPLGRDPGMVKGSKIYVGGNLYQSYEIKNCDIYVNGDLYLNGGNLNDSSIRYFVNGNVYQNANQTPQLWCNGKVYNSSGSELTNASKGTWDDKAGTDATVMTYTDMLLDLDNRTQTNPYYKWSLADKDISKPDNTLNHQTITVEDFNKPAYITYGSEQWGKGCVVDNITVNQNGGAFFIVIDTGDNPDNVYSMRLMANRMGADGKKNLFSWSGEKGDNVRAIVLVKGRGSVVLEVPKDVIYQDTDKSILCHYNWWALCGGKNPESYNISNGESNTKLLNPETLKKYVHFDCGKNCTQCVISAPKESDETCTREVATAGGGTKICGNKKLIVKCTEHDVEVKYCPVCEKSYVYDSIDKGYIICKNHVDKKAVLATYNNLSQNEKNLWNTDSKGLVYPNSNIFLISSEESADFRFGTKPNGGTLGSNSIIGYVYAPYVTFFAYTGGSGNDAVKFMGGMTVSDYNFYSDQTFIMCVPDKNPTDLMGEDALKHKFTAAKDWKITLVTH